jgi:two-component system, OmpR family, phosphate regulon response regulator PhoB
MCPSPTDVRRRIVMVVDDERAVTNLLSQILEKEGFEVQAFNSSVTVSKRLAELRPDVILLDFEMPVMTGPELAVRIKRNATTENIPIIFLSGMNHEDHHLIAKLSGATAYLAKPVEPAQLSKTVRQVLGQTEDQR